jgi:hypothetical protein
MKNIFLLLNCICFLIFISITSVPAQSLEFSQVLVTAGGTVPAGYVWKIESVLMDPSVTIKYTASSGSGSCASACNGGSTKWTSFTTSYLPNSTMYALVINGTNYLNISLPVWLPEGTQIGAQGPTENAFSTAGGYGSACICPPLAYSVTGMLSIIEFKVNP